MELSLANHVHELDPGQDLGGRSKGFETEHGSGDAFDGAVILLDDIVEVFDLTNLHRNFLVFDDLVDGCFIGAALVHGHFLRNLIGTHGLLENRMRAFLSRLAVSRKSTVLPALSTAR